MARQFANNATTTLDAGITDSDLTFDVTPGTGGGFPSVDYDVDGDWFDITFEDTNGVVEIVRCVEHPYLADNDKFRLDTRGAEGTTASAFNSGTRLELRLTAAALNGWLQADGSTIDGGDY